MSDSDIQTRLVHLRNTGFIAREVLDIGAYTGSFAAIIRRVFPEARISMFEANEAHSADLQNAAQALGNCEVNIGLLSDVAGKEECFYTLEERAGIISTGSSVYLEDIRVSGYVPFSNPSILRKLTTTVDEWFKRSGTSASNWRDHGLVKLDVQGAELDVLRGAAEFLAKCNPRFFLLETSIQQYNTGAPLVGDVFAFFQPFARMVDVLSLLYDQSGRLLQMDLLFERNKG
jgi:FkbM family methyltransferase